MLLAAAAAALVALPAGARPARSAAAHGAGRVKADVYVQVVQRVDMQNLFPRQLGVAHIQVHASDVDPSAPLSIFGQTADEGWVSCESAAAEACALLPTQHMPIFWADFASSSDPASVSISFRRDPAILIGDVLTLHDGGSPGNRLTGETSETGSAQTADWLRWSDWRGRPSFEGWVIAGNIHITR